MDRTRAARTTIVTGARRILFSLLFHPFLYTLGRRLVIYPVGVGHLSAAREAARRRRPMFRVLSSPGNDTRTPFYGIGLLPPIAFPCNPTRSVPSPIKSTIPLPRLAPALPTRVQARHRLRGHDLVPAPGSRRPCRRPPALDESTPGTSPSQMSGFPGSCSTMRKKRGNQSDVGSRSAFSAGRRSK